MKKIIISATLAVFSLSAFAKDIQELVVTTTPPMTCQNCENRIKKGDLRFLKGVKKIETNLAEQRVTVEYDADVTNPEQIENTFHKIGYNVEVINPENNTPQEKSVNNQPCTKGCAGCCKEKAE